MKTLEITQRIALRRILFATDFSPYSNAALPYALAIAHQYGAKLFATHVMSSDSYLFAPPESWSALVDQAEPRLLDVARLEEHLRGVPHQVMNPVGDISDVLFRLVRDHEIDLLVLGTHGRTGLPKLLMGSVAEKIFRQASIPVLTVGPGVTRDPTKIAQFNRILFATDFSDESLAAAPYALSLAQEHEAHLSLLHVLEHPHAGTVDYESNADFVIRRLEGLVPMESGLWFRSNYAVEFGTAEQQILKFAELHKADLIVLGVRAPQGAINTLTHLAHSKSQQIVAHATCPVLTVRG
ncbi:MAG: universal stress protein [Terriglobales bacterium]|jgi:nucleotide-binding universal stress UspA family protein